MIKGILFDIDGVIVDSEAYQAEATRIFFQRRGCMVTPEDFLPYIGAGENRYIGCVAEKHGISIDIESAKTEVYTIFGDAAAGSSSLGKMPPMPGIVEFVAKARRAGLKMALASSADRMKVDINLRAAGFKADDFDFVITGSQIKRKKPFGDIYLACAINMGLSPDECIVVEDAENGVAAARAAGCSCIGVLGSFSEEGLRFHGADLVFPNLLSFPDFDSAEAFNEAVKKQKAEQIRALFPDSLEYLAHQFKAAVLSGSDAVYGGNPVTLENHSLSALEAACVAFASIEGKGARIKALVMRELDLMALFSVRRYCNPSARVFIAKPSLELHHFAELVG